MDDDDLLMVGAAILALASCFNADGPPPQTLPYHRLPPLTAEQAREEDALDSELVLQYLALTRRQFGYGVPTRADDLFTVMSQNPATFKHFTNFFPPEFEELFTLLEPLISEPIDIRGNRRAPHLRGQPRTRGPSGRAVGRPPKLSLRSRFTIFLAVMRGGMSLIDQIATIGHNQQALSDDFYHILFCALEALDAQIQWPNAAERMALRGSLWDFPSTSALCPIGIIDGTIQEVSQPGDASEPLMYCSRKSVHGYNHQIVCRWDGKILAVFPGFYGSNHDSICYRMTDLYTQRATSFSDNETLMADAGYEGCGIMHVEKAPTHASMIEYNRRLRRHRVLIEFVIGSVKNKFQLVQKCWVRGANRQFASDAFVVACQLLNFWMSRYGYLRGVEYQQKHALERWEAKLLELAGVRRAWDADECVYEMVLNGVAGNDLYTMFRDRGVI